MEGHGTLGRVQNEEFAPAHTEQGNLVGHLKVRKEGNITGPFHGAEEQPRRQFADVINAHDTVGLHTLGISGGGVGFGPEKQRDVTRQERVALESAVEVLAWSWL